MIAHSEVLLTIKKLLTDAGIEYRLYEHAPVYTSQDAAAVRNTDISQGAKALVMYADKTPILVVVPGDKKADFKKVKVAGGIKDLRMATHEEVLHLTGLEVGSIPPLGKALGLKSYYDSSFLEKDEVAFNAGAHTASIVLKATDLIKVENPVLSSIT